MKPDLNNIMNATLEVLGVEPREWELNQNTRQSVIIKVKELFCLLAYEYGYNHSEIGRFIHQHRTSVIHNINVLKDHCDVYPSCNMLIEDARALISPKKENPFSYVTYDAYIARCRSGMLIISSQKPEGMSGYWISCDAKPFYPQDAFPKLTYEKGPAKVKIKITLDENEEV